MELARTALMAVFSILVLFLLTKLMGYRQVSELSLFDYINGITIGSLAADLALARGKEGWRILAALAVYGLAAFLLSVLTDRFIALRRGVTGKPLVLYRRGKLYDGNFKRAKLDLNEFQAQCRNSGYFDLAQVDTVLFEANGKLSILPLADQRPVTPGDMAMAVPPAETPGNVILDGEVMAGNLRALGYEENWLHKELKRQGAGDVKDVFLATLTPGGTLTVYRRAGEKREEALE